MIYGIVIGFFSGLTVGFYVMRNKEKPRTNIKFYSQQEYEQHKIELKKLIEEKVIYYSQNEN